MIGQNVTKSAINSVDNNFQIIKVYIGQAVDSRRLFINQSRQWQIHQKEVG